MTPRRARKRWTREAVNSDEGYGTGPAFCLLFSFTTNEPGRDLRTGHTASATYSCTYSAPTRNGAGTGLSPSSIVSGTDHDKPFVPWGFPSFIRSFFSSFRSGIENYVDASVRSWFRRIVDTSHESRSKFRFLRDVSRD